ncbi:TioE family transcriptional regulator [Streptomyces brasiliscabiei]|uniref:TioE family transcriptional regulator n=1 Tax=Streptomyces brasiliscabiei TaxID=2736302 RepID=UPI001C1041F3|nr:TioE family transcriptional regulator [Streptomyces brasiliscabiei]
MSGMRPSDLARAHGLSAQAVRNYERDGFLPVAERTRSGYRIYTEAHAAALRAFLALVPAYGHATAGRIMRALHEDGLHEDGLHEGALDRALTLIDRGHGQLLRDRETLDAVRDAVDRLTADAEPPARADPHGGPLTIGDLAHRLGVTPATLRTWEDTGILAPARDPLTGYRLYRPADVRDAELAHLLRRGGHPLDHIVSVVRQIRTAGGTEALSAALDDWRRKLAARGLAMLDAASHLSRYLALRAPGG